MKYLQMIEDSIITLGERKGSSRQAIWKCLHSKFPEADYKQFLIRLKKEAKEQKGLCTFLGFVDKKITRREDKLNVLKESSAPPAPKPPSPSSSA